MKSNVYILVFIVFLGLAGQTLTSWLTNSKFQSVLVEEESKKNEKASELEKEKFFEIPVSGSNQTAITSFVLLLKINFQSSLFHSLPERPPRLA